jgi:hypothetical protein
MYYHKSSKTLKHFNKHWTSSQLHVQWSMNFSLSPQNMIVCKTLNPKPFTLNPLNLQMSEEEDKTIKPIP